MNIKSLIQALVQHYERLIAAVVMLAFVVAAGWLVVAVSQINSDIQRTNLGTGGGKKVSPINLSEFQSALDYTKNPPIWSTNVNHRLFNAPFMKCCDSYGFPTNWPPGAERYLCGGPQTGIPYSWLRRYGLATVSETCDSDPDSDGFTVFEEWNSGTDPMDPQSKPDVALKLRAVSIVQEAFPFVFKGIYEGKDLKFAIARKKGDKEYQVKRGEEIPDVNFPGYKALDYREIKEKKPDPFIKDATIEVDLSELVVQKDGQQSVTLIRGKVSSMPELAARLYFDIEKRYLEVGQGGAFKLQGIEYQVITIKKLDAGRPEVVIRRTDNDKRFTLLNLIQNK